MSRTADASRLNPSVTVQFDHPDRRYEPLDEISVRYQIDGLDGERPQAVEHSIAWYTEGKGEEDLGVHFFERLTDRAAVPPAAPGGGIVALLPRSPLSYEGLIVKVRWCCRVRIFFKGGRDFVSEHVFELGRLPPARPVQAKPS
jgi:hypothetical protein